MYLDIFTTIVEAIGTASSALGLGWIVVIGLSLLLLAMIISFICTQFSIELRMARAVVRINKYLEANPFITEENLVEFNKLMKRIPEPLRIRWQQYMVNRDKKPSEFFSVENCIDRPFRASAYASHLIAVRVSVICIALLSFAFGLSYYANGATDTVFSFQNILSALLLPSVVVLIGEIYLFFLKARRNSNLSNLFYEFDMFQKYIDRASTTLPEYVDYEILFTRKEITSGIPVLQEYLQKRALYEQEQIQKAKESQVVHEFYDFSALGINGSLVMERAMRECEYFIGNKRRILTEISELESSRDMLDKSYDDKNKNSQRKLRDIQESLDRLKEKLDNTTNLIVGNDLRKQRENEIQKLRQLEKEVDEDNKKYEAEKKVVNDQIEAKRAEIEEFRKGAENSLNGEFKTYADKIYAELKAIVDGQSKELIDGMNADKEKLQQELEERDRIIVEKNALYDEKLEAIDTYTKDLEEKNKIIEENDLIVKDYEHLKREVELKDAEIKNKTKQIENQREYIKELKHKKNFPGDTIFVDELNQLYYIDSNGNRNYIEQSKKKEEDKKDEKLADEQVAEEKKEANEGGQNINFDFEQENTLVSQIDEAVGVKEEPIPQENLEELKSRFHKPVYDFKWENSNSQMAGLELEQEELDKQQKENQEAKQNKPEVKPVEEKDAESEEKAEAEKINEEPEELEILEKQPEIEKLEQEDEIDKLDKMIEEQNEKLEKQNQDLSKQLEDTKRVAEEEPKKEVKKAPVKKQAAKKVEVKKPAPKKVQGKKPVKEAKKQPIKKPVSKRPVEKKVESKKPVQKKPVNKKTIAEKPQKKVAPKKLPAKQMPKPEQKKQNNMAVGDIGLANFNRQLKNMLDDIDGDKSGNNK